MSDLKHIQLKRIVKNASWIILSLSVLIGIMSMRVHAQAIESIEYRVSWPEPHTHYYHVRMDITRSDQGSVDVRVPAWRPGRYIIQNYARYFIGFNATDENGNALPFQKTDKGTWRIEGGGEKNIVVTYKNYARVLDAGESYLDETEAYINPITVLMYVPGAEFTPSVISFDKPDEWRVATALEYDQGRGGYPTESYHELVDSPFIISPSFDLLSFEHDGARYELVFQGEGNYDPEKVIADVRSIAEAQTEVMQVTPFDRYVFLYHLLPTRFGHGVEHKNSTSIVIGPTDFDDPSFYRPFLSVTSHELFHVWNVERIRPEAIYYPDYSKEAYTSTMWIYEGITSYYTSLTITRGGLQSPDQYLNNLARTLQGYDSAYGRKITSVAMSSWDSWVNSDAPPNTSYSFYTAGNVLGLLLDLEIRGRTQNEKSLDDVFRYLYAEYAAKDRGVPEEGFEKAIQEVTGSSFQPFFDAYVYGVEEIDYNDFLKHAGLRLEKDTENQRAILGVNISDTEDGVTIRAVTPESGAEKLGLMIDDILVSINDERITDDNIRDLLSRYEPGDQVDVAYFRKGMLHEAELTLSASMPDYSIVRVSEPTRLQESIYSRWIGE